LPFLLATKGLLMKQHKNRFNDKNEEQDEQDPNILSVFGFQPEKPEFRLTGIYGSIEEEKCSEVTYGLLSLHASGRTEELSDPNDETSECIVNYEPIDFIVSTFGGLATEMFAIYDLMRSIRDKTVIRTRGVGKVMSGGVLLLAAGTKGHRHIGKYCRVMIHGVMAGTHGLIADVENEFAETKFTQKMYIKALAEETDMTEKQIKRMVDRKTNIYIDAEEAVKLGIADVVF